MFLHDLQYINTPGHGIHFQATLIVQFPLPGPGEHSFTFLAAYNDWRWQIHSQSQ